MSEFKITTDGIEEFMADLLEFGELGEANLGAATKRTTGEAYRMIVDATPGSQKREWDMRFPEKMVGEVSTNSKIMHFLEYGTGLYTEAADGKRAKYKIAPRFAKALAFQGSGGKAYQVASRLDGRAVYRSKAGNMTVDKRRAANLVVRNYVMHPGIKPVRMVRNNLARMGQAYDEHLQAALDATVKGERLGP